MSSDDVSPSGASSPRSQPASSSLTHDDDAAETQANAAAIRAARHAEARRRALERASARAKASRGLKASLQAETAAPSPPPAPRIDENDRERWWEEDEDAENQAESKDDDDDDDDELAASFEKSVAVKTVTAASSGRREMPTRRPRLALPPPSLPTGKPRTNPHQIGVSTHAKHKAKAAVKASASSTHAGVPKTLGMAMCSCCGKKAYSKKQPEHSTVLRWMGMPPPARVNMPGYDKAKKKGGDAKKPRKKEDVRLVPCARCASVWYCGEECARDDWHHHRRDCAGTRHGYGPPDTCGKPEFSLRGERPGTSSSDAFMQTSIGHGR